MMREIKPFALFFISTILLIRCDSGSGMSESANATEADDYLLEMAEQANDVWEVKFPQFFEVNYEPAELKVYSDTLESVCGHQNIAMDNFYCGTEKIVYLSEDYLRELKQKHPQQANVATRTLVAHLFAHHIQYLNNVPAQVARMQSGVSSLEAQKLMVRMELQTEYLAGVQLHHSNQDSTLKMEEIGPALATINAFEQDLLKSGAKLTHSYTPIDANRRARWVRRGFQKGDLSGGDTFGLPFTAL